jgi:hypothetical protein
MIRRTFWLIGVGVTIWRLVQWYRNWRGQPEPAPAAAYDGHMVA